MNSRLHIYNYLTNKKVDIAVASLLSRYIDLALYKIMLFNGYALEAVISTVGPTY